MRTLLIAAALLTLGAQAAEPQPLTLLQLYDASRLNDPVMRSADFAHRASQNEEAIGRGGLLPQLSISSRYGRGGRTDGGADSSYVDSDDYQSNTISLVAQQPIYDKGRWAAYQEAKARGSLGESQYDAASQSLFDRVTKAYFAVSRIENELKLIGQQKAAIAGLLEQAKRLYDAGQGAVTDIDEAQARYDLVQAQEAENQANRIAALRTLAGRGSLPLLEVERMRELPPQSDPLRTERGLDYWTDLARNASPELAARAAQVKVAEAQAETQRAGHYPTLSLTGQLTRRDNSQYEELSPRQDSYYVGLALDIPLYRGGATSASVRKASEALSGAQADFDAERQQLAEDVETDYMGVVAGFAKCKALQRAVESNQKALTSTEKGYQGGVRSTVDILDAQQRLFEARRDLLNGKLDMLTSYVSLHVRTGQMDRAVLEKVQELF
ncbi:TolC family outer membrane protein [Pseudomonas typographi]|uniref:TolC family outer membrane protein n=1 Tax=Pseudomonas typographi TaxID=2715964 RepID=UPI001685E3BD|nr:TolC family outer membrane protein [Pseudomonas typographi]MBD1553922.1 TolC family outer membrane protein [Pseudomonas typographi]